MAAIPVRNFATLVGNFAAGVQGRARDLVDFSTGSVLRAVAESASDLALWLQSLVVYVLSLTRAATSRGVDLDTWYADWFFTRLPAIGATGSVTFSRFAPDVGVLIPVGTEVATGDGTLIYAVYADPTHPAYVAGQSAYLMGESVTDLVLPVAAVMPAATANASAWNVSAGQITDMRSSVAGIDTVRNEAPFSNGLDQESDAAFQGRFPDYIASFAKATPAALRKAVRGVQQNLQCVIKSEPGHVTVVVDDGSGQPSADLVNRALSAVAPEGAGGVWISVVGATRLPSDILMSIEVDAAYDRTAVGLRVTDALGALINRLTIGQPLRYTALAGAAYAIPGVLNASGITLNGERADLIPAFGQTVKPGHIVVSPGA